MSPAASAVAFADEPLLRGHALLRRWARERPHHAAFRSPTGTLDYAGLLRQVDATADELRGLGVRPGDVVAFQLPNWTEAFVLLHAVMAMGAIALPLLPALRERDLAHAMREAQVRLFVTTAHWRGTDHARLARAACGPQVRLALMAPPPAGAPLLHPAGRGEGAPTPAAPDDAPPSAASRGDPDPASLDAVCAMIFTSGTSGRPKAVLYTHRGLAVEGREMARVDGLTGDDVMFMPSAIGHISGISFGLCMPMHVGATVCLLPDWQPEEAVALIARERCTWTAGATPFLQGLVRAATRQPGTLASLRVFRCGGASVPPELVRQARALGIDAYRSYGLSEHPTVTGRAGQPDETCLHADGAVHPLAEVRIVDPQDPARALPPGEEGEILTRGPDRALGYLRPADEAAARHDGWLLTGDLGRLSADGVLRVTGRRKDIIIRKGENISAREIEDVLAEHPAVADVAVVGVPDAERGEMVCCVVVARGDTPPDLASLCKHLTAQGLPRFKLPERLALLPALPTNAGGKVRKPALRAWLAGDPLALHE